MRKYLEELVRDKTKVQLFFHGSAGNKLVSVNGILIESGDDFVRLVDLYGNILIIPMNGVAYIEIKK